MEPDFYERGKDLSLAWIRSQGADGIIAQTRNPAIVDKIVASGLPACVSGITEPTDTIYQIKTHDTAFGQVAADYLLERGFQSFAYCGFEGILWSQRRAQSYSRRLAEAGFPTAVYETMHSKRRHISGPAVRAIAQWLKTLKKPVAILAGNDDRALEITLACKMTGLEIPDQVSILGVDNDELICDLSHPPLSSIRLNTEKAGYQAAEILHALMQGKRVDCPANRIDVLPLHVVTRHSTDILAIDDPEVAAAIRYIRDHAKQKINVDEIAQKVTLSKRTLQQRFKKIRGHSVHDEIKRMRIDSLTRMLLDTNLLISQIAEAFKFQDVAHLSNWFKQEKGMSPSAYRKKYANV